MLTRGRAEIAPVRCAASASSAASFRAIIRSATTLRSLMFTGLASSMSSFALVSVGWMRR